MNYAQLGKEYQILLPLNFLDKKIFVCCSHEDYSYKYFELCDNNFVEASQAVYTKLDTLFKRPDALVFSLYFSTKMQADNKQTYSSVVKECVSNILNNVSNLKEDIKFNIVKNFRDLKIIDANEASPICQEKLRTGSVALYTPKDNVIVLPSDSQNFGKDELTYNIQHELIHCATSNSFTKADGFVKEITKKPSKFRYTPVINAFIGLNEVMTEYVNNQIITEKYGRRPKECKVAYDTIRVALTPLLKELNQTRLLECFYSASLDGLVSLISEEFFIQDQSVIYRLFSLADLALNSNDNMKYPHDVDIVYQCYNQLYMTVCSFLANKHFHEGKDMSSFKVNFFDNDADFESSFFYRCMKQSQNLQAYIKKLCRNSINLKGKFNKTQVELSKYEDYCIQGLAYIIMGFPLPDKKEFDVLRNFETLNLFLSEGNYVVEQQTQKRLVFKNDAILKTFISPVYNYLPRDKKKVQAILDKVLLYCDKTCNTTEIVPTENIISLCSRNKGYLDKMCYEHFDILLDNIHFLDPIIKLDSTFLEKFINHCAEINDEDKAVKTAIKFYLGIPQEYRCDVYFQYTLIEGIRVKVCKNQPNQMLAQFKDYTERELENFSKSK